MDPLGTRISGYLDELCRHPDRHPGRRGNREATAFFARVAEAAGLDVSVRELDCLDWAPGDTTLTVAGESFDVRPGPYSNPCDVSAPLAVASTVEELEGADLRGRVLLLRGDLSREQLIARDYPFFQIPGQARILDALDAAAPSAIVAATGRNPELAGGAYPFPLISHSGIEIPHAYLTDVEGERLASHAGELATFGMATRRIEAQAQHVVARRPARRHPGADDGMPRRRVVAFGHIDSVHGAPGALDNATGTAALLGLAELLGRYDGALDVELVPFNGEDYFGATGERAWIADNEGRWDEIVLGLNADGAGWRGHGSAVSTYGCPDAVESLVRAAVAARPGFAIGEQWYQSDHSILLMHGTPAIAVTTADFRELCATVTHTTRDSVELADPEIVADISRLFFDLICGLG